ncbi:pseudouridine synthase pus4 [Coemansia sp. RSA 552]|nr:pseudouridine synthase pus4 [Coemansia sp. RSA 552]
MLGVSTASRDAEGTIVGVADASGISGDMVQERIPEFIGDIKQMPPMHSAIKVNGQPLYRYAREGWKVPKEVEPRAVTIRKIKLLRLNNPVAKALSTGTRVALPREHADYFLSGAYQWRGNGEEMVPGNVMLPFANHPEMPTFQVYVESGGGVYIRSLIHDLGERLGCGATMISLIRTTQGPLRLGRDTIEPSDLPFVDRVIAAVRQADNVLEHRL